MSDYWHKAWACPYYKWNSKDRLVCEAGAITMRDSKTACEYYEKYCANTPGWEKCTMAIKLTEFYERGDAEMGSVSKSDLEIMVIDLNGKIGELENELGRYKKKTKDQLEEIQYRNALIKQYEMAAGEMQISMDTVLASMVTRFGDLSDDGEKYSVSVPKFDRSILDEYAVGARKDEENDRYIIEAVKVRKQENPDA